MPVSSPFFVCLPARLGTLSSLAMVALLLGSGLFSSLLLQATWLPEAAQAKHQSRLGQLLKRPTQIFLPPRLTVGEAALFHVRGQAGEEVVLLYGSSPGPGVSLPNGQQLNVATESPFLRGQLDANGLLQLELSVPDDESIVGQVLFVDAMSYPEGQPEQAQRVTFVGPEGRAADQLQLVVHPKPSENTASRPLIMPNLPGFDTQALRQVTSNASIMNGEDERRKELLDYGRIRREDPLQRNSLQGPGSALSP
jgi:hypothetical protein